MLILNSLCEFSREYCVAICAFLVPANLLVTCYTLLLLWFHRPQWQLRLSCFGATIFAFTLIFHVSTWLIIGVITPVTFVLLTLASNCLLINFLAILLPNKFGKLLEIVSQITTSWLHSLRVRA